MSPPRLRRRTARVDAAPAIIEAPSCGRTRRNELTKLKNVRARRVRRALEGRATAVAIVIEATCGRLASTNALGGDGNSGDGALPRRANIFSGRL